MPPLAPTIGCPCGCCSGWGGAGSRSRECQFFCPASSAAAACSTRNRRLLLRGKRALQGPGKAAGVGAAGGLALRCPEDTGACRRAAGPADPQQQGKCSLGPGPAACRLLSLPPGGCPPSLTAALQARRAAPSSPAWQASHRSVCEQPWGESRMRRASRPWGAAASPSPAPASSLSSPPASWSAWASALCSWARCTR